jgi:hypothetical protein
VPPSADIELLVLLPSALLLLPPSSTAAARAASTTMWYLQDEATVNDSGFAIYKRPNNQRFVIKGGVRLDNRWIVPHNIELLKKHDAHINTEWCNKSIFIKYLFKYVTKGPDCSKAYLQKIANGEETPMDEETNAKNEVKEYLDT